jgi:ABC-type spermidine/putrescine transport system permease subunit I
MIIFIVVAMLVGLGGCYGVESIQHATSNDIYALLMLPVIAIVLIIIYAGWKLTLKKGTK